MPVIDTTQRRTIDIARRQMSLRLNEPTELTDKAARATKYRLITLSSLNDD